MPSSDLNIRQLILVPALISLGVTVLRLVGEINNWAPVLFSREAGGGGAIVGISWLPIIFGVYFALKLANGGHRPANGWKIAGFSLLAIAVMAVGFVGAGAIGDSPVLPLIGGAIGSVLALFVLSKGWPELFKTLLAYAFAARIPVALLMLFAILGDWGTHYDAPAPGAPEMAPFVEWFMVGVIPQMTFWIAFTVLVGNLFGGVAIALTGKGAKQTARTA